MYKELVSSIESNLKRFAEVPELDEYKATYALFGEVIIYDISRYRDEELMVRIGIKDSTYVFEGKWEAILARVTELWVNG